jgi:ribonucleoside-diphosphate reductase alpha chain
MNRKPYAWLNDASRAYLNDGGNGYLRKGSTPEQRVRDIGRNAESILGVKGYADKFEDYMSRGWFSLATPIWTNFGLNRGLPISCYGSHIDDSTESIVRANVEVSMMSKYGGGTSVWMGDVRPRGSDITDNGKSDGTVPFAKIFETTIRVISQGGSRRGECAAWWPIGHPDVKEMFAFRKPGSDIQKLSYGLSVDDAWLNDMINGDKEKREIWAGVIRARRETGYPFIMYVDNANRNAPKEYRDQGRRIKHSNLCVTGDQRVVSDRGLKTAKELYEEGGSLVLFDGDKRVNATPMRLVESDVDVYRITLANGMTHTVTGYHKVKVRTSPSGWPLVTKDVACADLSDGALVAVQTEKGVFGDIDMPEEAFLLGMYQGDGTQTEKLVAIDVWEDDFDLLNEIQQSFRNVCNRHDLQVRAGHDDSEFRYKVPQFVDCTVRQCKFKKKRLVGAALKKFGFRKGVVPDWIWTGNEKTQWQYIRGLLYTDGTVCVGKSAGNPLQLSLSSVDKEFLGRVQLILANLGVPSAIHILRRAGKSVLPDGRGSHKAYDTKDCWRLCVSNKTAALTVERETGFLSRRGVRVDDREYRDNTKKYHAVVSIEHVGKDDVYCCTVDSDEHHWVCNGVVTHNCSEISLPNNSDETFVCCVSSMNDLYFDEWKDTDAPEVMVYLLDSVLTEFANKAYGKYGMDRAVRFVNNHRALGIGQLGWHSYLQSKMIPMGSMDAMRENVAIASRIKERTHEASRKMARDFGRPSVMSDSDRRHATLTAIAPTKSSSFILGQMSAGINSYCSNLNIHDLQKIKHTARNPFCVQLLESKGMNTDETWDAITKDGGSVKNLAFLSAGEKDVFKTYTEIEPMTLVRQAAQRQKYVDQSQSLNLLIDPNTPTKEVNALYLEAWRSGVVSLYYQDNVNAAQQLGRSLLSCQACEG